jgi:hypothetical protein
VQLICFDRKILSKKQKEDKPNRLEVPHSEGMFRGVASRHDRETKEFNGESTM